MTRLDSKYPFFIEYVSAKLREHDSCELLSFTQTSSHCVLSTHANAYSSTLVTSTRLAGYLNQTTYPMIKMYSDRESRPLVSLRPRSSSVNSLTVCLMLEVSDQSGRNGSIASRMSPPFSFLSLSQNMTSSSLKMKPSTECKKLSLYSTQSAIPGGSSRPRLFFS